MNHYFSKEEENILDSIRDSLNQDEQIFISHYYGHKNINKPIPPALHRKLEDILERTRNNASHHS